MNTKVYQLKPAANGPAVRHRIYTGSKEGARQAVRKAGDGVYEIHDGDGHAAKITWFRYFSSGSPAITLTKDEAEETVRLQQSIDQQVASRLTAQPMTDAGHLTRTAQQVLAEAGLDFVPERRELFSNPAPEGGVDASQTMLPVPSHRRIVRGDTGLHLSVMAETYTPVAARDWFGILDQAACDKRLDFTRATMFNATQELAFRLPGCPSPRVDVGGALTTSHDGTCALRATASVRVQTRNYTYTIYSSRSYSTRHTTFVADRVRNLATPIMNHVVESSESLIAAVAAAIDTPLVAAVDVVLRTLAERIETRAKVEPTDDDVQAAAKRAKAQADARTELLGWASAFDTELGGLRAVLAAGEFGMRNGASDHAWNHGTARDRATEALLAIAAELPQLQALFGRDLAPLTKLDDQARQGHVAAAKARLARLAGLDSEAA